MPIWQRELCIRMCRQSLPCLKYFWHLQNSYWQLCRWNERPRECGRGLWKIHVRIRSVPSAGFRFPRRGFFRRFSTRRVWAYVKIFDSYFNEIMQAHFHTFNHSKSDESQKGGVAIKGGCSPAADSLALGVGYSLHMWVNHMHFEVLQATNALPRSNFGYLISAPHEHTQLQVCWHTQLKLTCPQTFCVWGRKLG